MPKFTDEDLEQAVYEGFDEAEDFQTRVAYVAATDVTTLTDATLKKMKRRLSTDFNNSRQKLEKGMLAGALLKVKGALDQRREEQIVEAGNTHDQPVIAKPPGGHVRDLPPHVQAAIRRSAENTHH